MKDDLGDYIADGYEAVPSTVVMTGDYVDVVPIYVAQIGDTKYETLKEAVAAVPANGETPTTITMLRDVENAEGMTVLSGKNFIVDFAGHTYTLNAPGAGSAGTERNGFQILRGSTVVFKNGTINVTVENLTDTERSIMRIIQNYAKLTLEDMTIDATNQFGNGNYAMSFNSDPVSITGNTSVILKDGATVAFDADGNWGSYPRCKVTVNTTGTIDGYIELGQGELDIQNVKATGIVLCTGCGESETTDQTNRINISGGLFSSKPNAAYIAAGKVAVENTNAQTKDTYPWTIGIAPVAPAVDESVGTTSQSQTTVPSGAETNLAEKVVEEVIGEITGNTAVTGESASNIQSEAVENALKEKITGLVDSTSQLKITVKSVATTTTETMISAIKAETVTTTSAKYDVKPYVTVETKNDQGEVTGTETRVITNTELAAANVSIKFRLAVPESMKSDQVLVKHYPDDANTPDWSKTYTVQGAGSDRYVELEANSFSIYEIADYSTTDYVALNVNTDALYETLSSALEEAQPNQTVILLKNISNEKFAVVNSGVTLDLNGFNITGAIMIYATGTIKDTAETKGYVQATAYSIIGDNEHLAVYDKTVSGYRFYNVKVHSEDGTYGKIFRMKNAGERTAAVTKILEDTVDNGRVKAGVVLEWNELDKVINKTVTFTDSALAQYAAEPGKKAFSVKFKGLDTVEGAVKATAVFYVQNADGNKIVSIKGETWILSSEEN